MTAKVVLQLLAQPQLHISNNILHYASLSINSSLILHNKRCTCQNHNHSSTNSLTRSSPIFVHTIQHLYTINNITYSSYSKVIRNAIYLSCTRNRHCFHLLQLQNWLVVAFQTLFMHDHQLLCHLQQHNMTQDLILQHNWLLVKNPKSYLISNSSNTWNIFK